MHYGLLVFPAIEVISTFADSGYLSIDLPQHCRQLVILLLGGLWKVVYNYKTTHTGWTSIV